MYDKAQLSVKIKEHALSLGFNAVGIAKAQEIEGFNDALSNWLKCGYHADMDYMNRNVEKRCNPQVLVEGAKSVISLLVTYYPNKIQPKNIPQIAKYAYGIDYHFVLKDKMNELWHFIAEYIPELKGRMFVDSAPVSDKIWAVQAGLGWLGKNSCLINKDLGSFVFICELILNVDLEYDEPYRSNFCGSCTKCIDACPTKAIIQPGVVDSNKCISYQTIENKQETIDELVQKSMNNRLFGCDICQDVCPWNRNPVETKIKEFKANDKLYKLDVETWQEMDAENFNNLFRKSALKRAKLSGLKRNLEALIKKE